MSHWHLICFPLPRIISRAIWNPKTGVDRSGTQRRALTDRQPQTPQSLSHIPAAGLARLTTRAPGGFATASRRYHAKPCSL